MALDFGAVYARPVGTSMTADLLATLAAEPQVHLWQRRLDLDTEPSTAALSQLGSQERERAARFRRDVDRRRFIGRHLHLRDILARYLRTTPGRVPLMTELHRAPHLAGGDFADDLQVSLSSSADRSIVAVAWRRPLGVDIEAIDRELDIDATAHTVFSPCERQALNMVPPEERRAAFFRIWTRKEAFVKALGLGFSRDLMSFDVMTGETRAASHSEALVIDRDARSADPVWRVADVAGSPEFALACCARGDDWAIVFAGNEA